MKRTPLRGLIVDEYADNTVWIKFDRRSLEQCRELAFVASVFLEPFGSDEVDKQFRSYTSDASHLAYMRNVRLMAEYVRRGSPSPEKFGQAIAVENGAQRDWSKRLGTGSTIASTLTKQVRRLQKHLLTDADFRQDVADAAEIPDSDISF
jgi:hypothetical protein